MFLVKLNKKYAIRRQHINYQLGGKRNMNLAGKYMKMMLDKPLFHKLCEKQLNKIGTILMKFCGKFCGKKPVGHSKSF